MWIEKTNGHFFAQFFHDILNRFSCFMGKCKKSEQSYITIASIITYRLIVTKQNTNPIDEED